ncbi:TetR/AcrR family transcriptional regulator C-terminal domain-containing protein [Streptomyces sp. NPDC054796]
MTKKQAEEPARTRLDVDTVVRTALALLEEKGAEAVSLRGIAQRLGVRMNTVLWHAKTKTRLLELMADAIVAGVRLDGLPDAWDARVRELVRRYRRALLAHRDGARIVAGTYAAEPATFRAAEALVQALLDGGLGEREAAWTCWTLIYFALGLTQEEQSFPAESGHRFARRLADGDDGTDGAEGADGEYPALSRVMAHFGGGSFDERFEYGVSRILQSPA